MDEHISGPSFRPGLTGLSDEPASLRPRVGMCTPEQSELPVRPSRHEFTLEFEFTDPQLETTQSAGTRLLLISSVDLKEKSI